MIAAAINLIAAAAATATVNASLERPTREDTIYVLHGDPKELESFESTLGDWEGGELIEKDLDDRAYYYWAYSERTAPQARQFIMPAMLSGLEIAIQEYDQEKAFPELRAHADTIAIECGATEDPFFVSPTGEVQLRPSPKADFMVLACALKGARASDDIKTRLVVVGNEAFRAGELD